MLDSATLKANLASKGIRDLNELLREGRPFTYVVETDTHTCQRATFAKKNKTVIDKAGAMIGQIVYGLRSALDHAYWEIVAPFSGESKWNKINVQFPFSESAAGLEKAVKKRLANRVSTRFFEALIALKPYSEPGGNEMLCLIDELGILDKHRHLIPTGDYTRLSSAMLQLQVPDFPRGLVDCHFGSNRRDIVWRTPPHTLAQIDLGPIRPPTLTQFEKELDVPVDIVFQIRANGPSRPVIPTLNAMVDVTQETIKIIRAAAP